MNTDSKDKNANIDLAENSLAENSVEEINSSEKYCSENSDNTNNEKGCCHKTKERTTDEQKKLMNRLSRIEGQIRGIKDMDEKDAYRYSCTGFCRNLSTKFLYQRTSCESFSYLCGT